MADVRIAGREVPRWVAIASAVGGLFAVYFAYKQYQASKSSSSSASNPSATDPVTGLPYSEDSTIDPLTGMAYLAEAQEYGSVSAAEQAVSAENASTLSSEYSTAGTTGTLGTTGTTGTVTTEVPTAAYTTNAQWVAAATAGLEALGYSASDVNSALAAYLANLPETATQAGITQTAINEYGPPPVGSYTIVMASSTTTAAAGSTAAGSTANGSAPSVIDVAPSGFRVVNVTGGDNVNLAWNPVKGATGYVIAYGPTSGSQQYKQDVGAGNTSATVAGVGGGTAGKHYFELWATPAPANGPHAGPIEATTTKS
jgi:hypothetical protein